MSFYLKKTTVIVMLVLVVFGNLGFILSTPKPAAAFWGIGDFSFDTEIANFYDVAKTVAQAAMERVALSFVNRYLTNFINKMLDKYKIRNYLYYGRMLDSYYLENFVADKIDDPDLRNAYQLLQNQLIKIRINPVPGQAEVAQRLLKQFKLQVDTIAQNNGAVSSDLFTNPPAGMTEAQRLEAASQYYVNNSSYVADDLRAQFVAMQAQAQAAADQEIDAGKGLKSSRSDMKTTPPDSPEAVERAGTIRGIIENPAGVAQEFLTGAINKLFDGNLSAEHPTAALIGSAIGNFIFQKLTLDSNDGGILPEYPIAYTPGQANPDEAAQIDTDSDGIPEGEDVDGDGRLASPGTDICYQGGIPNADDEKGCSKSTIVGSSVYFTPFCQSLARSLAATQSVQQFINDHADLVFGDGFKNKYDASVFARRLEPATAAIDDLINAMENYQKPEYFDDDELALGRFNGVLSDLTASLIKDQDLDIGGFLSNGGGGFGGLKTNTDNVVQYLKDMQNAKNVQGKGRCDDGNSTGVNVTPPDIILPPDPESEESCQTTGALHGNDDGAPTGVPDVNSVVFEQGDGVAGWAQTSTLSSVSTTPSTIYLPYDKTNDWPGVDIGGGTLAVANPWILVWRDGAWHATTFSWFRPGQTDKDIGDVFCGALGGGVTLGDFEPQAGDTYGFMVSGVARNMALNNVQERTNIVMYKWPGGIPRPAGTGSIGDGLDFVNHTTVVENVINELKSSGVDLTTPCGVLEISKRVAWELRDENAGLLSKTSGNNCNGYATDIVAYPSGFIFDIVGSAGESNSPQWILADEVDPSRYVPAFQP